MNYFKIKLTMCRAKSKHNEGEGNPKNYFPELSYTFDSASCTGSVHTLHGSMKPVVPLNNYADVTHFRWERATIDSGTLTVEGMMDSLGPSPWNFTQYLPIEMTEIVVSPFGL